MFRLVIFSVLISVSLTSAYRYRRNEGNEDLKHYYRPKYVYKFQDDEDNSSGVDHDHQEYKYVIKEDHHKDSQDSHFENKHGSTVTDSMAWGNAAAEDGGEKETNHHVEIEHEHGTSHQSFQMHHFKPVPLFIKKHDLKYVKKPVEISTTKHKFKFVHPKPKTYIKHEYANDDSHLEFDKSFQHKEFDFKDYKPQVHKFDDKKKFETHYYKVYQNKELNFKDLHKPTRHDDHKDYQISYPSKDHQNNYHNHKIVEFKDYKPKHYQHEDITVYRNTDDKDHYQHYLPKHQHHTVYQDSADDEDDGELYQGGYEQDEEQPHYVYDKK